MAGLPLECALMLGYAFLLALIALALEWVAGHAHRRSLSSSTVGFTYHPERDVWRCPQDQHLFPIFSDSASGRTIYRAPADACNSCRSKAACTDSHHGREIEKSNPTDVENGMKRFHRALSLTLLVLASVIILVELLRTGGLYVKFVLGGIVALFSLVIQRLSGRFRLGRKTSTPA